jgi:hypothetical protein
MMERSGDNRANGWCCGYVGSKAGISCGYGDHSPLKEPHEDRQSYYEPGTPRPARDH